MPVDDSKKKNQDWKVKNVTQSFLDISMSLAISFGEIASTILQLLVKILEKSCNLALHVLVLFRHELISTANGKT
jgi:hypothetical protein